MSAHILTTTSRPPTTSRPYRKREIREVRGLYFPSCFPQPRGKVSARFREGREVTGKPS